MRPLLQPVQKHNHKVVYLHAVFVTAQVISLVALAFPDAGGGGVVRRTGSAGRVARFASEVESGKLEPRELAEFLRKWLVLHVLREGMRYIPAVAARYAEGGYP